MILKLLFNKDESILITDNGRGIPIGINTKTNKSTLEVVFTVLHAGGKFNDNSYKVSGGLHGVGASVVNALSSFLKVNVYRDNKEYEMIFKNGGKFRSDLKIINETVDKKTGTSILFKPDFTIFLDVNNFNYLIIKKKIKQAAFLNKNLKLSLTDLREDNPETKIFKFENGIFDYVKEINNKNQLVMEEPFYFENKNSEEKINFEFAFQYNTSYEEDFYSFCNNIHTIDGGTHVDGFKFYFVKIINEYYKEHIKKNQNVPSFNWDDVKEGLVCVLSVFHVDPQFEGQTKTQN